MAHCCVYVRLEAQTACEEIDIRANVFIALIQGINCAFVGPCVENFKWTSPLTLERKVCSFQDRESERQATASRQAEVWRASELSHITPEIIEHQFPILYPFIRKMLRLLRVSSLRPATVSPPRRALDYRSYYCQ